MGFIHAVRNWLRRNSKYPTIDEVCFGDEPNPNQAITEDRALTYTAFWAAVNRIANDVAKLPIHVYRQTKSGLKPADDHPVGMLLHDRPNEHQTPFTFRQTCQGWALSWGNSYSEIVPRGDGSAAQLIPISPGRVTMKLAPGGGYLYEVFQPNGAKVMIPAERMLHVHGLGDGFVGYSPVALFRQNLSLSLNAEQAGANFFGNGFRPGAVLSHPQILSDEAFARLKKSMEDQSKGKAGSLLITEEGMKLEQWTIPPDDAQFLETRQFQIQDIARIFNIPPHKLGDLSRATFSNIEEQSMDYVVDCLQPWLTNWEQELEWKLFSPQERKRYRVKFSVEGILRGNSQARADFYSKLFNIGVMSINDIRSLENLPTIGEAGDEHYVPVNLQTAEKAAAGLPAEDPTQPPTDNATEDDENANSEA
jgi:HK97 family phage portal protein